MSERFSLHQTSWNKRSAKGNALLLLVIQDTFNYVFNNQIEKCNEVLDTKICMALCKTFKTVIQIPLCFPVTMLC